jgi:beta-glucosidase
MKRLLLLSVLAFSLLGYAQSLPIYLDESKPMEARIDDALSRMTLEEKVAMCHAQSKFSSRGVPSLGIPDNWMSDGPHGIRAEVKWDEWNQAGWTNDSCMAFPALTCLAASWNPEMSLLYGKSIGAEARYRNKNVLLGPGVNIYRTPLNGRNFEYLGEDPYLSSRMVIPYIQGVQSNGVAACVKHFALNNQEVDRHEVNVTVSDRALYEIYLPAFKAAVTEGHAWAIMGSYNKYKNQWCCQNQYTLQDILRKEWNFDGVVVSDWGGVNNTMEAATRGLDMEFGTWTNGLTEGYSNAYDNYFLANSFLNLLRTNKLNEDIVNQKVRNILRLCFRTTMNSHRPFGEFASKAHGDAARKIAEDGIVLLQNRGDVLPFNPDKVKKVAVIGENAIRMMTVGGGSSSLKVRYEISPLQGISQRLSGKAEVIYARGYKGELKGGQDGINTDAGLVENRSESELAAEAVKVAKEADAVIFIGGLNKNDHQDCEGVDRESYGLPYGQDALISQLAKVNKNLAVVIISGNAVAMPWVKEVPSIVESWYLGSEAGNAIAATLFGDVNPSGKLPFTFPVRLEDNCANFYGPEAYPGVNKEEKYAEDIFVGYRWNEIKKITPLFAFGHGLSYTKFKYGKLTADHSTMNSDGSITFSIDITNIGSRTGSEVVQLYISDLKCSLPRPVKELKAFDKVSLNPGETKTVHFTINKDALSFFDAAKHAWVAEPGMFKAHAAAASDDVRSSVEFQLK